MSIDIDESKRRPRRGGFSTKPTLSETERRLHTISTRLNQAELLLLDQLRATVHMRRGEYLRAAALHKLPPTIPAINRDALLELKRIGNNINQIAHTLNTPGETLPTEVVKRGLNDLHIKLIGLNPVDIPVDIIDED